MAKNDHKEDLFEGFFSCVRGTVRALEQHFYLTGVEEQVFGPGNDTEEARRSFRSSNAWKELDELYEYAINGVIDSSNSREEVVLGGADVIELATSHDFRPSPEWDDIVAMGDARFALDEGQDFFLFKVALLAKVDMRTVRNAVSAGQLTAYKRKSGAGTDEIYVDNASARRWLIGRKGYKPTAIDAGLPQQNLNDVNSPVDFAAFLVQQRKRIGLVDNDGRIISLHPRADANAIAQLEAGVFLLPLDAVFPLADFYQVNRKAFLQCVMRNFFHQEWELLKDELVEQEQGS